MRACPPLGPPGSETFLSRMRLTLLLGVTLALVTMTGRVSAQSPSAATPLPSRPPLAEMDLGRPPGPRGPAAVREVVRPSSSGPVIGSVNGPTGAPPAGPAQLPAAAEELHLYVGQAHVLNEPRIKRIAVGNGRVLQATSLDDRQVLVIPENPGQSTLHLWQRNGRHRHYVITVVTADANRLQNEVRAMIGEAGNIRTRIVGDKVVIEGGELSEEQANRLGEVSRRYPQIVNLISKVGLERMIAMDVRMVEIKRELMRNIGVKWNGSMQGPTFGILGDAHRSPGFQPGGFAEGVAGLTVRPAANGVNTVLGIASSITSMINLMVQNGDAVVLAEPRLACRSGGSARFLAGGELPIPQTGGLGTVSVSFKEYGVKFEISPVASESGVISAHISTEVSAINFDVAVREIPGLSKRRAETEVNLRENETLVIAGLMSEETTRGIDRVAGLGELPILGALFRSRQFRDRHTDLVVFITPRFVDTAADTGAETSSATMLRAEQARTGIRTID